MLASVLFLSFLVASTSAVPVPITPSTTTGLPFNVALPGPTPAYTRLAAPALLPFANVTNLLGAVSGGNFPASAPNKRQVSTKATTDTSAANANANSTTSSNPNPNANATTTTTKSPSAVPGAAVTCLDSSSSELQINSLFSHGGAGTVVSLCPGATISILYPIQFTAARQSLRTEGLPTDSTRATILVMGANQGNAITTSCWGCDGASLRSIQVNGNRPARAGYVSEQYGSSALVEMGGSTIGQIADTIRVFEPRTWSAFHAIEGDRLSCRGLVVMNSQFGPAGNAPSTSPSKKRNAGVIGNEWADGMSIACGASNVFNNVVIDATDGGIVVFQAPNSTFSNNTVISSTRNALGGLNMVDYAPWGGDFSGVLVSKNTFITNGAMMKVAIAMGPMVWGDNNSTQYRTSGGKVAGNHFYSLSDSSTSGFGYGIAIAGHGNATINDNIFANANFNGQRGPRCTDVPTPSPGPAYIDLTSSVNVDAPSFVNLSIQYLLCLLPDPTASGSRFSGTI